MRRSVLAVAAAMGTIAHAAAERVLLVGGDDTISDQQPRPRALKQTAKRVKFTPRSATFRERQGKGFKPTPHDEARLERSAAEQKRKEAKRAADWRHAVHRHNPLHSDWI